MKKAEISLETEGDAKCGFESIVLPKLPETEDNKAVLAEIKRLNLQFFNETNKFSQLKEEIEKTQDTLYILLFKQISLYSEEVARLTTSNEGSVLV